MLNNNTQAMRVARARRAAKYLRVVVMPTPRTGLLIERRCALRRRMAWLEQSDPRYLRSYWAFDLTLGYNLSNVAAIFGIRPKSRDNSISQD